MEVPEPSTVSFIGSFFGLTVVSLDMEKNATPAQMRPFGFAAGAQYCKVLCGAYPQRWNVPAR
jgi:hypothetical protein